MGDPVGDRRWIAVMSGDMANFTRLPREIGQERAFGLLEAAMEQARASVEAEGGRIVDTAGDGFLAIFGAPMAHEDASLRACRAALSFRDRIAAQSRDFKARFGAAAAFRIGLTGGTAMIMRYDDGGTKVLGDPVNLAARLQDAAELSEVLIGEDIHRECEGHITVEDRGSTPLKGFDLPMRRFALTGLSQDNTRFSGARRRGLTRLVRREGEITRVQEALGAPDRRAVAISGVAGIGKSRLAHEAVAAMGLEGRVLYGQCVEGGRPYVPIFDLLGAAAKADRGLSRAEILQHLADAHPGLFDPGDIAALFSEETGTDVGRNRALRTREFLTEVLAGLAETDGHVLVIEDVHWIDPGSSAVLEALLPNRPKMIVTHRPTADAAWLASPRLVHVALSALPEAAIAEIASDRVGAELSADMASRIVEKSEGIPLVAEELLRAMRHGDRDTAGGAGFLTGNLEQSVLSRADRLDPQARHALATAAAIGREFSADLLARAIGHPADLGAMVAADLVEQVEDGRWRFLHALIRDAVYAGMLSGPRAAAHLAIATALEARAEAPGADRALIGRHFAQAGVEPKAATYLARGAADALADFDLITAERLADRAMTLVLRDPAVLDDAAYHDLVVTLMHSLHQLAEFKRLVDLSRTLLPRMQAAGQSQALGIVQTLVALSMSHTRDYAAGEALALGTLERARQTGDRLGAAWAGVALMRIYEETGQKSVEDLEALADDILPVAEEEGDPTLYMTALYQLSAVYRVAGRRGASVQTAERLRDFAVRTDNRRGHAFAAWAKALSHIVDDAPELAYATMREGRKHALPGSGDEATCRAIEFYGEVMTRPSDALEERIADFIVELRRRGDFNLIHAMNWIAAVRHLRQGELALGWHRLNRDLQEVALGGNMALERQFRLLKSEILLTIAGLIEPRADDAGDRDRARKRSLRDLAIFLRLRPFAARDAGRELERCLELEREAAGANYARAKIGLGLVALRRGDIVKARGHLEAGQEAAAKDGIDLLVRRARTALQRI